LESEIKLLKRQGIAAMKSGDRAEAHRLFKEMLRLNAQDPVGLVFAGVTAPNTRQTEKYLRAAQKIDPNHPAVRHGWKWLQAHRKAIPPQNNLPSSWVARNLGKNISNQPNIWLISAGTLVLIMGILAFFLALVLGTFYYLNVLRPATQLAQFPTEDPVPVVVIHSATFTPRPEPTLTATATITPTQSPTNTRSPTQTHIPTASHTPIPPTNRAYAPVTYNDYTSDPQQYAGKTLRLTGTVVGFGEARLNGKMAFALLLGPAPGEEQVADIYTPLVVLGIAPDPAFELDKMITIYGLGGESMDALSVQGVKWNGPVLLGERFNAAE
jgi:hypothetical protein